MKRLARFALALALAGSPVATAVAREGYPREGVRATLGDACTILEEYGIDIDELEALVASGQEGIDREFG